HFVERFPGRDVHDKDLRVIDTLRRQWKGGYVANGGFDRQRAEDTITKGLADAIAFGRPYIANPDLVERLRKDAPLNEGDPATYYGGDEKGYIDYPFLDDAQA